MDGLGMCSPDEYEAAFYPDSTNANLDTIIKVGNPESSLQESGGSSVQKVDLTRGAKGTRTPNPLLAKWRSAPR